MQDTEIFPLRAEAHHPWHLYAGVVLTNKEGKIAIVQDPDGSYTLPRETVSSDDALVRLVHRLVLEQIGVVPHVRTYIGSHTVPFDRYDGTQTEKTILYFTADFESPYHAQFSGTETSREGVEWKTFEDARVFLKEQPWGEEKVLERIQS